ncbi:N-anthranilate isomerase [Hysterangium stoloniferum]|nr:N-anthranilate isomerase [Hysterangium stoloniferum]
MAQLPKELSKPVQCLMIDNFDSFSWNLYQQLSMLGADVVVVRNDALEQSHFAQLQIQSLVISPGPGHPKTDSGISREIMQYFAGKIPVLGVCMGLECLVDMYGGEITFAGEIMHGKTSHIRHDGRGCLKGLEQGFSSIRYHSLSAEVKTLPEELTITAVTEESGVIMGVRHRTLTLEAVQYHPESILSEGGNTLIKNFLELKGGTWDENPGFKVADSSLPPFPVQVPNHVPEAQAARLPTILEKIHQQRLKDIETAKKTPGTTPTDLSTLLSLHLSPPLISLVPRLRQTPDRPALMAEIKRASPSKGDIAPSANAALQALSYAIAGASVISVLTEPKWFKGSLLDMQFARKAIDSLPNRPAILRKDFIVDEYQIQEARLYGADTVLLIVAMLPLPRLKLLYAYSKKLGMEPLVEVNNTEEMQAALDLGARVIGVNNRNLHNFEVDMQTTTRLADMVKERDVILCALSGIKSNEDVRGYVQEGVSAVLVGESLMRAEDPAAFIRHLLDIPEPATTDKKYRPLVKICGVRTPEVAVAAADAGADLLGLVLAPKSKRYVTLEEASQISSTIRQRRSVHSASQEAKEAVGAVHPANAPWFSLHAERLVTANVSSRPLLVGVFQGQSLDEILRAVSIAQLDLVQLHGTEPAHWAHHIPVPVIRAFHVRSGETTKSLRDVSRPGLHQFILLDSVREVAEGEEALSGGSGKVLDWEAVEETVERGEGPGAVGRLPVILAGGLTPDNVREIVAKSRPWVVDVSGGVETEDGSSKDLEKVKAFVLAAKDT